MRWSSVLRCQDRSLKHPGDCGWIIGVSEDRYVIYPQHRGEATPWGRLARATVRPFGLLFFRALCNSFHIFTLLFLPSSSVHLSYFVLAVPMHECSGEHSFLSITFPMARDILNGICVFARQNDPQFG